MDVPKDQEGGGSLAAIHSGQILLGPATSECKTLFNSSGSLSQIWNLTSEVAAYRMSSGRVLNMAPLS